MVDSGNIDTGNKAASNPFVKPKDNTPVSAKEATEPAKGIKADANPIYKSPSESQQVQAKRQLINAQEETILKKETEILAHNPVLAAQLQNPKKTKIPTKQPKQKPPEPSTRVQLAPKGRALNPRRVKPNLPGRLQSLFDDRIDNLSKLEEALASANDSVSLINEYAHKLLTTHGTAEMRSFDSLAVLMGLETDIADLDKDSLILLLQEKIIEFADEPQLKQILNEIVMQINLSENNNFLRPLLQFFLPIPFQFEFADVDEEFEEDEKETREVESKNDRQEKKHNEDDEDDESEDELEEFDSSASLSIHTLNYNKIHFFLGYHAESNQLKVSLNGDPMAMELAIPIESNMEDLIYDELDDIEYMIKVWEENVLRITDKRILKVKADGKLNPMLLKACNSILETIQDSDIDLGEGEIEAGML